MKNDRLKNIYNIVSEILDDIENKVFAYTGDAFGGPIEALRIRIKDEQKANFNEQDYISQIYDKLALYIKIEYYYRDVISEIFGSKELADYSAIRMHILIELFHDRRFDKDSISKVLRRHVVYNNIPIEWTENFYNKLLED